MNVCTFTGNVGDDSQKQTSERGKDYLRFSLAVSIKDGDDYKAMWISCVAFEFLAQKFESFSKGERLLVNGPIEMTKGKDGNNYLNMVVRNIERMGKPEKTNRQAEPVDDEIPF